MSLLPEQTSLDRNRANLNAAILAGAEAIHHCAATIKNQNDAIWSLPDAELLDLLNDDVDRTLAVFDANTAIGIALNERLDELDLPQFPTRAPVTMGRADVAFEAGQFVIVPPPVEEDEEPAED